MWTLRVREAFRHDRDISLVNNQQWDLDTHDGSHMFHDDLIDEPRCQGLNQSRIQFPLSIGMLLARDLIVGIQYLVQSRYRQVTLLVP